ncbi:hypothetical protein JNW88_00540 [Micromonospora sp. ATA32]|nr:hypothetical protein [Micromonospora sp. ATA32]
MGEQVAKGDSPSLAVAEGGQPPSDRLVEIRPALVDEGEQDGRGEQFRHRREVEDRGLQGGLEGLRIDQGAVRVGIPRQVTNSNQVGDVAASLDQCDGRAVERVMSAFEAADQR